LIYSILVIYQGFYLPLLSLPMSLIGLIDDKFNISKLFRFSSQVFTLLIIILYVKNEPGTIANIFANYGFGGYFVLLLFGTSIINFINFMDGIDGLITGSMIVIFLTLNGEFHYLLPIIGTLTGFLYFNWHPSKIFMGDTGSLYLGTFLVSLMFSSSSGVISNFRIILLCSPLFLDALICILRNLINKRNIFKAHKSHLYQRLVSNGLKHSIVASIYIFSIALLSLVYLFSNTLNLFIFSFLIFLFGIFIDKKYALEFNKTLNS
ncbi:hypothetical protein OA185_00280, partial [bacterium]|nr:hypothetical protein [bacterium]